MNKVYVCACTALVLSRCRGLPFYKSHGKSVPVAVTPRVMWKGTPGGEEEEEEERGEGEDQKRKEANTREKFHRIVIEAPREPFWAGRVYRSGDNRTQFLASLLWSGFTPSSSSFLPPSSPPLPPSLPLPGRGRKPHPAAAPR